MQKIICAYAFRLLLGASIFFSLFVFQFIIWHNILRHYLASRPSSKHFLITNLIIYA
jgi:hypothetical protein